MWFKTTFSMRSSMYFFSASNSALSSAYAASAFRWTRGSAFYTALLAFATAAVISPACPRGPAPRFPSASILSSIVFDILFLLNRRACCAGSRLAATFEVSPRISNDMRPTEAGPHLPRTASTQFCCSCSRFQTSERFKSCDQIAHLIYTGAALFIGCSVQGYRKFSIGQRLREVVVSEFRQLGFRNSVQGRRQDRRRVLHIVQVEAMADA